MSSPTGRKHSATKGTASGRAYFRGSPGYKGLYKGEGRRNDLPPDPQATRGDTMMPPRRNLSGEPRQDRSLVGDGAQSHRSACLGHCRSTEFNTAGVEATAPKHGRDGRAAAVWKDRQCRQNEEVVVRTTQQSDFCCFVVCHHLYNKSKKNCSVYYYL